MAEESDPFECRLTFLSLLQKLNASQQSIHKVATYAMRHRKLSEDLYSCLIEELEQVKYPFSFQSYIKKKKERERGKKNDNLVNANHCLFFFLPLF